MLKSGIEPIAACIAGFDRMLRVPAKAYTEVIPRVHYQKHALRADTLHSVGEAPVQVRQQVLLFLISGTLRIMSIHRR